MFKFFASREDTFQDTVRTLERLSRTDVLYDFLKCAIF